MKFWRSHARVCSRSSTFSALLDRAGAFFQHERFEGTGQAIARKRPHLRYIFGLVEILGRTRLGNVFMISLVVLTYRILRSPSAGPVFEFGMSDDNIRVLKRANSAASRDQWDAAINGRPLSLAKRFGVLGQGAALWRVAAQLAGRHMNSGFSHAQLVLTCAAFLVYRREEFHCVTCVCVASDHSPIGLGLLHAAREKGLRTCYIQHAPVADYFPPLDYDLSLLFDRASVRIYERAAMNRGVASVGDIAILPPFEQEAITPSMPHAPPYRVGLCLSYLFDALSVARLIEELLAIENVRSISIRRHPRCKADFSGLQVDRAVTEAPRATLVEFAQSCDIALIPNSGVAIELLHLGMPVMYTPGVDFIGYDYYGFVREGIVPVYDPDWLTSPSSLAHFFGDEWRQRFVIFDETTVESLAALRARAGSAFKELAEQK